MFKLAFAIVFLLMAIMMLLLFIKSLLGKSKNPVSNKVSAVLMIVFLQSLSSSLNLFFTNETLFLIMRIVWHCGTSWLLYFLISYLQAYARITLKKQYKWLILGLIIFDNCLLLSNIFYNWMLDFTAIELFGDIFFKTNDHLLLIHDSFCYILAFISIFLLIRQMIYEADIFRTKYLSILITVCIAALCHLIFSISERMVIDLTVFAYGVTVSLVLYFTIYHTPKILEGKIQSLLVNNSKDIFIVYDNCQNFFYANDIAFKVFKEEKIKESYKGFIDFINIPCDGIEYRYNAIIDNEKKHYKILHDKLVDDKNRIQAYYIMLHDITFEISALSERFYREHFDTLTKIYNRSYFIEKSIELVKENPSKEFVVVATNFIKFRLYNDIHGIEAGDAILKKLGNYLMEFGNQHLGDIIYGRMGSDNFAACMSKEFFEKEQFADKLLNLFLPYDNTIRYFVLGVCTVTDFDISLAFDHAVQAIHHNKDNTNNRLTYYTSDISAKMARENMLLGIFESSIKEGYFHVYLQPQVNSKDETVFGAEALIRWIHPEYGFISPGEFIPLLERSGSITLLDKYVWDEVFKYLAYQQNNGVRDLSISVNVSRCDFVNINIYEEFMSLSKKYNVSPKKVKIEITETTMMAHEDNLIKTLIDLQEAGFMIEMDDFGSGYSSLNILKDIPFDVIKLDMKFIYSVNHSEKQTEILNSIISMAHRLRFPVIAEGVETLEQINYLRNLNCELIQGFYYAKPMPIKEFSVYMMTHEYIPYLDNWADDEKMLYASYKEIDKYYGLYPYPILVLNPIFDINNKLVDAKVLYQNNTFIQNEELRIGNIIGKTVINIYGEFYEFEKKAYIEVLTDRKTLIKSGQIINGHVFNIAIYPLAGTNFVTLVFKKVD